MNPRVIKRLHNELKDLSLPFPHKFIYIDEDTDCETSDISGHVIYVEVLITPAVCNLLKKLYKTQIYFWFPDDYPFSSPTIMLEETCTHPLIDDKDYVSINMCSYCPALTFPQLIMNAYCIIVEALYRKENDDLIKCVNNGLNVLTISK